MGCGSYGRLERMPSIRSFEEAEAFFKRKPVNTRSCNWVTKPDRRPLIELRERDMYIRRFQDEYEEGYALAVYNRKFITYTKRHKQSYTNVNWSVKFIENSRMFGAYEREFCREHGWYTGKELTVTDTAHTIKKAALVLGAGVELAFDENGNVLRWASANGSAYTVVTSEDRIAYRKSYCQKLHHICMTAALGAQSAPTSEHPANWSTKRALQEFLENGQEETAGFIQLLACIAKYKNEPNPVKAANWLALLCADIKWPLGNKRQYLEEWPEAVPKSCRLPYRRFDKREQ